MNDSISQTAKDTYTRWVHALSEEVCYWRGYMRNGGAEQEAGVKPPVGTLFADVDHTALLPWISSSYA
jgi:hypothetical protein